MYIYIYSSTCVFHVRFPWPSWITGYHGYLCGRDPQLGSEQHEAANHDPGRPINIYTGKDNEYLQLEALLYGYNIHTHIYIIHICLY